MIDVLLEWLARYGYPVVFLAATLENVFPLGFLVPGEIIILTAAAASDAAALNPVIVAVLAATGETIGELISYALGRFGGAAVLDRVCKRFPRICAQRERAEAYFRKRGAIALVIGRPAWGVKAALPAVAGESGMPFLKTAALVTISSLYYYPLLVAIAYAFGLGVGTLSQATRTLGILFAALFAVLISIAVWRSRRARRR
jgi:membrane-associated protein